ncbi:DUF1697 domain-containing protein [Poritiphilus flavus]|uniref:DUF1697 domain-containing protein n=1 Tax=Poritiphilus flavus TaxID=2697053 RepID=A0A6L9EEM6_9FLAO|nr:DUF1697 domain-containing protein [Poritiphilus flavus]NAS12759.1 DUF1697 domain-containing protein [Poritiphilus flavus]
MMTTYIALLRGINVSGQKKIRMLDLKHCFERSGYSEVTTYIQSGNVVFKVKKSDVIKIADDIHDAIQTTFGFDVPVVVLEVDELRSILDVNPFSEDPEFENEKLYYTILKSEPQPENLASFTEEKYENEKCVVLGKCAYLFCMKGAGKAKLNNNLIERKLKVQATTRNQRTLLKLLALAESV